MEMLDYTIFEIGRFALKGYNLILLIVFIAFVYGSLFAVRRIVYRSKKIDAAKKYSVIKLLQYVIVVVAFLSGLQIVDINISVLLAGSAALLVGAGFGLQSLFSDFISGIILLLDGTLRVNDIIEVNDHIFKVEQINFRTTRVIGRDENYIIVPNSDLTKNKLVNWTHDKIASRFRIDIGVDYSTDVEILMETLLEVTLKHNDVMKEPIPFVRFQDYGESALLFSIYFFSNDIFGIENIKSSIRVDIFHTLKEKNIIIPFPQRVVHFNNNK